MIEIPRLLYRGFHGKGHDHQVTRLSAPTYTDSIAVAAAYAINPSHHEDKQAEDPRLSVVRFKTEKPYFLGDPETEDVASWEQLRRTLNLTEEERDKLITSIEWRKEGEWTQIEKGKWPDEEIYTDSYRLTNDADFLQMVRGRGYDAIGSRGTFTAAYLLQENPTLSLGSYRDEDFSVLEWRPLQPEAITELGVVRIDRDVDENLKIAQGQVSSIGTVTEESVRISDLDTEDIEDEYGWRILDELRPIRFLEPKDIACLQDRAGKFLQVSFEDASRESKAIVKKYDKADLKNEVIILDGTELRDGFHRAMSALRTGRCIRAIDLSDDPPKADKALIVVHPDHEIQNFDRDKLEKKTASTVRKILKWMDGHPHVPVSVILSPTPGAFAPETQKLLTQIKERAGTILTGESAGVAAQAVRKTHPNEGLILAGFYRDRCVKDLWRYLPSATIAKDLTMQGPPR